MVRTEEDQEGALSDKFYLFLLYGAVLTLGCAYGVFSWRRLEHASATKRAQAELGVNFSAWMVGVSSLALMVVVLWVV